LDLCLQGAYAKIYEVKWLSFHLCCSIYKFLQYFEVDIDEELLEVVKPSHEINNGSFNKMRFIKIGDKWVSKEEEGVGPSQEDQIGTNDGHQSTPNVGNQFEHEQDYQGTGNSTEQVADATYGTGPSAGNADEYAMNALVGYEPPIDRGIPMS